MQKVQIKLPLLSFIALVVFSYIMLVKLVIVHQCVFSVLLYFNQRLLKAYEVLVSLAEKFTFS
jgi:hypothetical protein